MTLAELLNSEMTLADLAAMARQGLTWWREELAALLPAAWRERLSSRPSAWIEPGESGGWRLSKGGRPWAASPAVVARTRLGLLAPPGTVLTREVMVPPMSTADARQMLRLDIDRLSPLSPDLIHFDLEFAGRGAPGAGGEAGRQRVLLGIVERGVARRLLAEALAAGYAPVALAARVGGEGEAPRFDFLPQVRDASGAPKDRLRLYGWIAAAALILVNLAVLVGRDIIEVSRLQAAVDAQRPSVEMVQRLRRRIADEDARRRDMIARGVRGDPLRVMDALTRALPQEVFVQRLEWNGRSLRLVGLERGDGDLAAMVGGAGPFATPKVSMGAPSSGAPDFRPFDLTADARPDPRR
jgi:general secretion pathway protein L